MKKVALGLVVAVMIFSSVSFAQTVPAQKPAPVAGKVEWDALLKKQNEARAAFNAQLQSEREIFLNGYPELANRVAEYKKKEEARKAAEQSAVVK